MNGLVSSSDNKKEPNKQLDENLKVYTKEEFEDLQRKNKFNKLKPDVEVDLNAYVNPRIHFDYKKELVTKGPFSGTLVPLKKPLKNAPFIMDDLKGLPTAIEEEEREKEVKNKALIQFLVEGVVHLVCMTAKNGFDSSSAAIRNKLVAGDLANLKKALADATNLNHSPDKRTSSWKKAGKILESLKNRTTPNKTLNSTAAIKHKAQLAKALNKHLFDGKDSVSSKLKVFWKKNASNFTKTDADGLEGFGKSLNRFKKNIKEVLESLKALLTKFVPGMRKKLA